MKVFEKIIEMVFDSEVDKEVIEKAKENKDLEPWVIIMTERIAQILAEYGIKPSKKFILSYATMLDERRGVK